MGETWYRGESSNTKPAKAGQYQMDYGDGLYLISDSAVAENYAVKRVISEGGVKVVTQVTIESAELGRVLDLNQDARWVKFIETPMVPGRRDMTPRILMKIQQNNYSIFKEFLSQNKIDITQYNAVRGPELTHGGTQLAILHRNGIPSTLAGRIRGRLVPLITGSPAGPQVRSGSGGKIRMTVRSVGGALVMQALSILMAWWRSKIDQQWIQSGLSAIEPQYWIAVYKLVPHIADLLAKGKKAYANVTIEIRQKKMGVDGGGLGVDFADGIPKVSLIFVDISADNINAEGKFRSGSGVGYSESIRPYMMSFELSLGPLTVKAWKDFMEEWNWYEKQMQKTPTGALRKQQEVLRQEMIQVFGEDADSVLKAWMWPKFKFKTKGS